MSRFVCVRYRAQSARCLVQHSRVLPVAGAGSGRRCVPSGRADSLGLVLAGVHAVQRRARCVRQGAVAAGGHSERQGRCAVTQAHSH